MDINCGPLSKSRDTDGSYTESYWVANALGTVTAVIRLSGTVSKSFKNPLVMTIRYLYPCGVLMRSLRMSIVTNSDGACAVNSSNTLEYFLN